MYEIYQGDNATLNVVCRDSDGDLVDITNVDLLFSLKDRKTDTVLVTKHSDTVTQIEKDVPASGHAKIYLLPIDTSTLLGAYEFDLELTYSNGQVETVLKDVIVIRGDISGS